MLAWATRVIYRDGEPVTVFLVDEFAIVRHAARGLLESAGLLVVGEAGTAMQAIADIAVLRPRVAVIGLQLPDGTGIDVCREVRDMQPSSSLILMTSVDEESALFAAVMAAADGYLIKQIRDLPLVEAIRRVGGGRPLLDPDLVAEVRRELRPSSEQQGRWEILTDEERRVLVLIAQGLTNREISTHLELTPMTVADDVSSLVAKMSTRYDMPWEHHGSDISRRLMLDWPSNLRMVSRD
jgi:two-component system response regulator DevR